MPIAPGSQFRTYQGKTVLLSPRQTEVFDYLYKHCDEYIPVEQLAGDLHLSRHRVRCVYADLKRKFDDYKEEYLVFERRIGIRLVPDSKRR